MISDLFHRLRSGGDAPAGRRQFFRRAAGTGLAALAGSTLLADPSWAAVEARAEAMGITPGTLVDAQGRPARRSGSGANPFVGEIMLTPYNFNVRSYALCNGQILAINSNAALFSLLGTTYGGNGSTTFALPDLRGRVPMHFGQGPGRPNRALGQTGGQESVVLSGTELPAHAHTFSASQGASSAPGTTDAPAGAFPARPASSIPQYGATADVALGALSGTTGAAGNSQAHDNMPPFLVLNYQISLFGIFPSGD